MLIKLLIFVIYNYVGFISFTVCCIFMRSGCKIISFYFYVQNNQKEVLERETKQNFNDTF